MPINTHLNQAELIIAIVGLAWSIMGMLNMSRSPSRSNESVYWVTGLVLSMSIPLIGIILQHSIRTKIPVISPLLTNHSMPLLYGPFFYFYIRGVLGELKWGSRRLWHFLPFILVFIVELIMTSKGPRGSFSETYRLIHSVVAALSVIAYGIWTVRWIRKSESYIDNHFSSRETHITLSWARYLAYGYIAVFSLSFLVLFASGLLRGFPDVSSPFWITTLPLTLFIFGFSYFAPAQRIIEIDKSVDEGIKEARNKYEKSAIITSELNQLAELLNAYMSTSKPYLDPDLTLEKLAGQMEISRHKISQVINIGIERSFYSYINSFRVTELSEKIKQNRHHEISMLGLAFECGFKSSSSFYSAIKKEVGMTPRGFAESINT